MSCVDGFLTGLVGVGKFSGTPARCVAGVATPIPSPGVAARRPFPFALGVVTGESADCQPGGVGIDIVGGGSILPTDCRLSTFSFSFCRYDSSRLISSSMSFANRYRSIHLPRLTRLLSVSSFPTNFVCVAYFSDLPGTRSVHLASARRHTSLHRSS